MVRSHEIRSALLDAEVQGLCQPLPLLVRVQPHLEQNLATVLNVHREALRYSAQANDVHLTRDAIGEELLGARGVLLGRIWEEFGKNGGRRSHVSVKDGPTIINGPTTCPHPPGTQRGAGTET